MTQSSDAHVEKTVCAGNSGDELCAGDMCSGVTKYTLAELVDVVIRAMCGRWLVLHQGSSMSWGTALII